MRTEEALAPPNSTKDQIEASFLKGPGSGKPPKHSKKPPVLNPDASYESHYQLESLSKEKIKSFIAHQMRVFSERFEFETEVLDEDLELDFPTEDEIYDYCKYVVVNCKMENEIPIICLVYLERLLYKTGVLLTTENWRRLVMICLCIGSKIWDDDSLENVHFPRVMPEVNLKMINSLEQAFLDFLGYDLVVKGSEYAKYYFILRTLAEEIKRESAQHTSAKQPS
eukprot:CAMPEP_0170547758 /NCGR_PEP_ID=MMETSP0211-20121228/6093_1 /TAXON_ID=311385 /ORGANISM="Pseudokeronopsis sp., Strain OXSARD2" /LENGTH=224 /DNA_ID=CAMNT_0010852923 /DNA_START=2670 /DNA_END=3343 /DNA_ORIENTATION=+